jgi:hypothetical protein
MLPYKTSYDILNRFYEDCLRFWQREGGYKDYSVKELALQDVSRAENDPYSPQGEPLDKQAKQDFLKDKQLR